MALFTTAGLITGWGIAAAATAVAGIGAYTAAGARSAAITAKKSQPQLPQTPTIANAEGQAKEVAKRKRSKMSQTIFTSPLGISASEEAGIGRKTLLGQ